MSFLARPVRPLIWRAASTAVATRRTFTTARSALLVSGYGRDKGATAGKPKAGASSIDPTAGGEVPEYTGPSIAEKKKGRAVNAQSKETEIKSKNTREKQSEEAAHRQGSHTGAGTLKGVDAKRAYSTSAYRSAPSPLWEDADRLKEKTANKMSKLKHEAGAVGADLKESAQELFHTAKKSARNLKEKVSDVIDNTTEKASGMSERAASKITDMTENGGVMAPMYEKSDTGVNDPITSDELPGNRLPLANDDTAAKMSAVPSSIFDGPQQMPQGVGRRAKNEVGEPMETGTERS